jgi:predicted nuclease of predicted toxin-antitoxin system
MSMKFKVDENLPVDVLLLLREAGYDGVSVHDQQLFGQPDNIILKACQTEQRVLITLDLDFADIRQYPPREYAGLIILRLRRQDKKNVLNISRRLIKAFAQEDVSGRLWIVDENQIKVRD